MKQDMIYDVAVADTSKELAAIVNRTLKRGWELVGGVSCSKAVDQGRVFILVFSGSYSSARS